MPDPAVLAQLTSGSSSGVVGLRTAEGEPFATRAWGARVVCDEPLRLRLLLPTGSLAQLGRHPGDGERFAFAVTTAHVVTLRAVQAKGTAHSLEEPTDEDLAAYEAYKDEFFGAINRQDGYARELLDRWPPLDVVAVTLDVEQLFDQTPGPTAGTPLAVEAT